MEITRKSCRLCLSDTEFNISLFGNHCRKTNMLDKILVCLKLVIEESDFLQTICYKCAGNVEKYYDFVTFVKKTQTRLDAEKLPSRRIIDTSHPNPNVNRTHVTSFIREQVFDGDYTFSFLEMPSEEKKECAGSSPFFSNFSLFTPKVPLKSEPLWKTPQPRVELNGPSQKKFKQQGGSRHHSRDLFESQSQDVEDEPRSLDWKLTPDDNILKRIREKCFGRSDF